MNKCDFCIDYPKKGCTPKYEKECEKSTHRVLRPTIRITTQCTQSCSHCCFRCSPKMDTHMSISFASKVNKFLVNNEIWEINLMGGEFFCNPFWENNIAELIKGLKIVRLVTNGDWAGKESLKKKVISFLKRYQWSYPLIKLAISNDKWHTNAHVDEAVRACEENDIIYKVETLEECSDDSIVPIGRSVFNASCAYSLARYCAKPERTYTFMIDEKGEIYKCPFGILAYDNVENFLDGGFARRFKEFGEAFRECYIMSCVKCVRIANSVQREMEKRKSATA